MIDRKRCLAVLLSSLTLQACTYYQLRNQLEGPTREHGTPCDISYSLFVASAAHTNSLGIRETKRKELQELENKYIAVTKEVFRDRSCNATYVRSDDGATLIVHVKRLQQFSALPQEWLTGLSFGLIPSWGTREGEFVYAFENKTTGKSHNYTVDTKSYNHLILLPVSWIALFIWDEFKVYKDALNNFIENS